MSEINITTANFSEEVSASKMLVLVDFWATWCGPCQMLAPIIEEISDDYAGRIKVGKVNVDEEPSLAMKYGISSIPAVLLFKDGNVVDTCIGYRPKEQIEAMIDSYI